jgi:hypothetical protein
MSGFGVARAIWEVKHVNVFPVLKDGDFSSESPTLQAST